jgi:hypothetical protein
VELEDFLEDFILQLNLRARRDGVDEESFIYLKMLKVKSFE